MPKDFESKMQFGHRIHCWICNQPGYRTDFVYNEKVKRLTCRDHVDEPSFVDYAEYDSRSFTEDELPYSTPKPRGTVLGKLLWGQFGNLTWGDMGNKAVWGNMNKSLRDDELGPI